MILAVVVLAGVISLWNGFTGNEDQIDTDTLVEQIEETASQVEDVIDGNQDSEPTNQVTEESSETADTETSSNEDTGSQAEAEPEEEVSSLYDEAKDFISDYPGITDVWILEDAPGHVIDSYQQYSETGWTGLVDGQSSGTKAGGRFGNYEQLLPNENQAGINVSYKEFDVNDKISGQSRDAERFVVSSDGSVYYTSDHYDSFVLIIK